MVDQAAAGPKKLKTENANEVTVLSVPLPVVWSLEQEVNVVDVGCGSRHTIVLLGKQIYFSATCFCCLKALYFCPDGKSGLGYTSDLIFHNVFSIYLGDLCTI